MTNRSPIMVFILSFITFGIYGIYWMVVTKNEMKARGADIPTAWLIIVPFVNIWWEWKFSVGVEKVTNKGMTAPIAFILLWILGMIGGAIIQSELNKVTA
ncbi:DUF4234 domain-containing protein [Chloroflexota bacterium]